MVHLRGRVGAGSGKTHLSAVSPDRSPVPAAWLPTPWSVRPRLPALKYSSNAPGPLQEAVRDGKPIQGTGITGELFCLVFQLFFKDALARFITTIVAGKVRLAFPLLHAIDPAGKIAAGQGSKSRRLSRTRVSREKRWPTSRLSLTWPTGLSPSLSIGYWAFP